jgi:hypothetical protein
MRGPMIAIHGAVMLMVDHYRGGNASASRCQISMGAFLLRSNSIIVFREPSMPRAYR